jgi:3-phenylpropionate/trans-cinnamate dioxygenase ferredoxin reductase subunit
MTMTGRDTTFVIVGASLAGAKAAETLRQEGFEGRVVLVGEEPARPYERPPLSKNYLRGEADESAVFVHDESFYDKQAIELRAGTRASGIDASAAEVVLDDGDRLHYDALLLTTGAAPRRLSVPGAELDGVHYLRTLEDSDRLREAISAAGRVVVIGAGWIGSEVAASARQMGAEVAMVEVARLPLERIMGPEVGGIYRDLHAAHGVELHLGVGVEGLLGSSAVSGVRLADGTTVEGDLVVVGVGVAPRVELAESAGLTLDNGIVVDDRLRTSAPNIFAAGDVANAGHPFFGGRLRVEHWANALNQGPAAARNMLGADQPYDRIPYFFSDQYDLGMEYSGHAPRWDRVVFRGDTDKREFIAFWLDGEGHVLAGMNANVWDVTGPIQDLIRARRPVDVGRLTDPDVPLESLAGSPDGNEP